MAVHNREGAEALRDLGFKRVVLARELTLDEITDICHVPGIEKEVFIHGALCYSYSGLCLFSSVYAGRSANRGKCVYPCRELFNIAGCSKHVFSMKDMAQGENVRLLEKAGVTALKIEGRKKARCTFLPSPIITVRFWTGKQTGKRWRKNAAGSVVFSAARRRSCT